MVPLAGDSGAGRPAHNAEARQTITVRHQRRHLGQHAEKVFRRRGGGHGRGRWRARAAARAAARAVPELAEIEKDAAPAVATEEDDDAASLDLVEDYTYVNPFDVHRFWNREVFVTRRPVPFRVLFLAAAATPSSRWRRERLRAQASSAPGGS